MPKHSRGTRSVWDILTFTWLRRATISDIDAVHAGESRAVSCLLRSEVAQLPRKFTGGTLYVTKDELVWKRSYRRSDLRRIPELNRVLEVRIVSHLSEWNIKRGLFKIIAAAGPDGKVEMAVPNGDVRFLRSWIEGRQPPETE
jgi:hypothetical protein